MSSKFRKNITVISVVILVVIVLSLTAYEGFQYRGEKEFKGIKPKPFKEIIITRISDTKILCNIKMYYQGKIFMDVIGKWSYYKNLFTRFLSIFGGYGIKLSNIIIKYNQRRYYIELNFTVYGAINIFENKCEADFLWLLNPLGLDFIDSHFKEYNDRLTWYGYINNTLYYIIILLPKQEKPYTAWGEPVGHCHGHIWWPNK